MQQTRLNWLVYGFAYTDRCTIDLSIYIINTFPPPPPPPPPPPQHLKIFILFTPISNKNGNSFFHSLVKYFASHAPGQSIVVECLSVVISFTNN